MFDLIIRNGRIVDGTGEPAFVGDVAIEEGRIVAPSPKRSTRTTWLNPERKKKTIP